MLASRTPARKRAIDRYVLYDEIGAGGFASVHVGKLLGASGFVRAVAVKRLHAHYAKDPDFVSMLLDEAHLAGRIRHPNVVSTLDVVVEDGEIFLVMDYVHGVPLSSLVKAARARGDQVPPSIAAGVIVQALEGLHAAHEATSEAGEALHIVHRDVSPQNILVGADGVVRVLDFGIAKAVGRVQSTRDGEVKGKAAYLAPEQVRGKAVDRRTDVYAAFVVLWETLAGERLFLADGPAATMTAVLERAVAPPSSRAPSVPAALDAVVLRGLARDPEARFATARDAAVAVERTILPGAPRDVEAWVATLAAEALSEHSRRVAAIEKSTLMPAPGERVALATSARTERRVAAARRRAVIAGAGAALAIALTAAVAWHLGRRTAPGPSNVAATAPAQSAIFVDPGRAEAPAADIAAFPASSAAAAVVPARATATPRAKANAVRPGVPRRPSCSPPYTVDAEGIRIAKPECL